MVLAARPTRETLESLRVTLHKLEQATDPASNGHDVAELKQILLNRIAELETLNAMQPEEAASTPAVPSDLPPLAAVTEQESVKETFETTGLEKLD